MKKLATLVLSISLAFGLTACSGVSIPTKDNTAGQSAAQETEAKTEAVTEAEEKEAASTEAATEAENAESTETENAAEDEEAVTVIVDTDEAYVAVKGYDPNGEGGYTVYVDITNKTDHNLMFSIEDSLVNLNIVHPDPKWEQQVEAGGELTDVVITWPAEDLEGIEVEEIRLMNFVIYDLDSEASIFSELITLNP